MRRSQSSYVHRHTLRNIYCRRAHFHVFSVTNRQVSKEAIIDLELRFVELRLFTYSIQNAPHIFSYEIHKFHYTFVHRTNKRVVFRNLPQEHDSSWRVRHPSNGPQPHAQFHPWRRCVYSCKPFRRLLVNIRRERNEKNKTNLCAFAEKDPVDRQVKVLFTALRIDSVSIEEKRTSVVTL